MSTPSKFPSSAYFSAAMLVVFFFLTCFQAQGQVSSVPKDTVLVLKKEKVKHVRYPFYLDASLENLFFFYFGANANAGIYLNSKHAIGISYFIGAAPHANPGYDIVRCLGLQYCGSPFKGPWTRKSLYYKIEVGKVLYFNPFLDFPEGRSKSIQQNTNLSKPYMIRGTFGIRYGFGNLYLATGTTGKLFSNYTRQNNETGTHFFRFYHVTFGVGFTLPYRKNT
jgi:hypothetical protein